MKNSYLNIIENDTPEPWDTFFQDNATPQMEGLEELHNNIMFYLAIILFAVSWMMISIIINFKNKKLLSKYMNHDTLVELIWTIIPALILILIVFHPFKLSYLMDEDFDPALVIHGEGHQWYYDHILESDIDIIDSNQGLIQSEIPGQILMFFSKWIEWAAGFVDDVGQYKGQTLRSQNMSVGPNAPLSQRNNYLGWLYYYDPGAFFGYDPNGTIISEMFLHRASKLPFLMENPSGPR